MTITTTTMATASETTNAAATATANAIGIATVKAAMNETDKPDSNFDVKCRCDGKRNDKTE